ncbi:hypothetical protein [Mesorhizobium sp. YR577]|uniref:hypothetical protein n=1 Tax=Mesorhizobium sp. YR577 TaxID=1884373 RepID=UPI0008E92D31|nr:hypothetical protein [Mesorhizobium sp. YR577]SFU16134.1 hypothetical protein SAMN05518861_116111 [Mesorhizobium sp. YR577]
MLAGALSIASCTGFWSSFVGRKDAGAFVVTPHPEWYGLTVADAATIPGAHAVEVYNHTSQVRQARGGGAYYLDDLLKSSRRINALAADDAHWVVEGGESRDAFGLGDGES